MLWIPRSHYQELCMNTYFIILKCQFQLGKKMLLLTEQDLECNTIYFEIKKKKERKKEKPA